MVQRSQNRCIGRNLGLKHENIITRQFEKNALSFVRCRPSELPEPRGLRGREPLLPPQPDHDERSVRLQPRLQAGQGQRSQVPQRR